MLKEVQIPEPFTFNPFKHHKSYIYELTVNKKIDDGGFRELLDSLGSNYLDIYTGRLSVPEICEQVGNIFKKHSLYDKKSFKNWVRRSEEYKIITLDDGSKWLMRFGKNEDRYIHFHPAKYGPCVVRYKANSLKTVLLIIREFPDLSKYPSVKVFNKIRKENGMAPVKKLYSGKGILKCWNEFRLMEF